MYKFESDKSDKHKKKVVNKKYEFIILSISMSNFFHLDLSWISDFLVKSFTSVW